ncbi:hypothetical protein BH11ARM1_BH11ARM1_07800 [soil metagenome]
MVWTGTHPGFRNPWILLHRIGAKKRLVEPLCIAVHCFASRRNGADRSAGSSSICLLDRPPDYCPDPPGDMFFFSGLQVHLMRALMSDIGRSLPVLFGTVGALQWLLSLRWLSVAFRRNRFGDLTRGKNQPRATGVASLVVDLVEGDTAPASGNSPPSAGSFLIRFEFRVASFECSELHLVGCCSHF